MYIPSITQSVVTMDSVAQGNDMARMGKSVIVLNHKGAFVAKYNCIADLAREYHCSQDCIRKYIDSGKLWKAKKVFLDLAL